MEEASQANKFSDKPSNSSSQDKIFDKPFVLITTAICQWAQVSA